MSMNNLDLALSLTDDAKSKLYFLSSALFHTRNNTEMYHDEGIYALAEFIGEAAKDVEAAEANIKKYLKK